MKLPSGIFHQRYQQDHAWWQTRFVWGRMLFLMALALVVLPLFGGNYVLSIANSIGFTVLAAMGVQLLIGYTGQITLGHAAFVAVGAYTSAILMLQYNLPYPLTVVLAAIAGGITSVLFGLPAAKVKGFYLIMTTMAAQFVIVDFIITQYISQVGGRGTYFSLPPGTVTIGPWAIQSDREAYYLMVVLVIMCTVFVANLLRTRVGRAWMAIRDNDIAAQTLGVNVFMYKMLAFFVAGVLAGIAGAFNVTYLYFVSPEHYPWFLSLWLVGVILIGGVGSLYGVFFGSMFVVLVMEGIKFAIIPLSGTYPQLLERFLYIKESAFGLAIVLFMIFEPSGLAYRWWQYKNYIQLWPFSYTGERK